MLKKKNAFRVASGLIAMVGASSAFAAAIDLAPLTSAVDFTSVGTAVIAIAGLLAAVYVAVQGSKIALRMIRA